MQYSPFDYPVGRVVRKHPRMTGWQFGHIVGFSRNCSDELLLRVRPERTYRAGQDSKEQPEFDIHPSNVLLE